MRIVLISKYVFDPLMLEKRAVRGIMTSIVGISRALAHLGHEVRIFTRKCPQPGIYEGVEYLPIQQLAQSCRQIETDVLISLPPVLPLLFPISARARVVWTHDVSEKGDHALSFTCNLKPGAPDQLVKLLPLRKLDEVADRIFVISDFQMRSYLKWSGLSHKKFFITRNGVFWEHFVASAASTRYRHRLVYLSEARRGLDVLLNLFPRIRGRVPDCELHIFSPELGFNKKKQEQVSLADLQSQFPNSGHSGVIWQGALPKRKLAQELLSSSVMAYPCHFQENFPTAVAEAQAAGLPIVTSAYAGLTELIDSGVDGFLISMTTEADVYGPTYQQEFIERVVELLQDDLLWERMSRAAQEKARSLYDWHQIAQEWEKELTTLVQGRTPHLPPAPEELHLQQLMIARIKIQGKKIQVPQEIVLAEIKRQYREHGFPNDIPTPFLGGKLG